MAFDKALHGRLQFIHIDRLEQVVKRTVTDGLDSIFVVGRCKDDLEVFVGNFFQHFKAIHMRHLDIQEDQAGLMLVDFLRSQARIIAHDHLVNLRNAS